MFEIVADPVVVLLSSVKSIKPELCFSLKFKDPAFKECLYLALFTFITQMSEDSCPLKVKLDDSSPNTNCLYWLYTTFVAVFPNAPDVGVKCSDPDPFFSP